MVNKNKIFPLIVIVFFVLLGLNSCQRNNQMDETDNTNEMSKVNNQEVSFNQAVAVLTPTEGNDVSGVVTFTKVADGIKVEANIMGLKPGKHGFHIHEYGDIRKSDGTSAGGHFNPHNVAHGAPSDSIRHVGDLGNIIADENGNATYDRVDRMLSFSGVNSIIGRGVIVHEGEDDLTSQPTGAAGKRVAMGVIGIANPDYVEEGM